MEDMKAKGISEKEAEAVRFSAFSQWCTDKQRTKTDEIKAGEATIAKLSAGIEKDAVHIKKLTSRIEELEESIATWTKEKKDATVIREKEAKDYAATSLDYSESLAALDQAIVVLKKKDAKTEQSEALLQVQRSKLLPAESRRQLTAFLQQPVVEEMPDEKLLRENPEAYGYEFQSGGVIDMLEKLKDQFSSQKYTLDKEEMTAKHAFENIAQQLTDNVENAKHEVNKKTTERSRTQEAKATKEGEKAEAEKELGEDKKYLEETKILCMQKTDDFNSRKKLREEEIAALSEAIEIISSDGVSGVADKHLPTMLLQKEVGHRALAQLRSSATHDLQKRVAEFLEQRAKLLSSRFLEQASMHVAADPFTKVKKMIKDLISTLMKESTEEIEHKGWCDTELSTNKLTRDEKTEGVQQLTLQKEELTNLIAQLTQDIEDLTQGIAELDASMKQAQDERAASKAKNEETIAEAKESQTAVQQAIAVLKDYYAKSAQATAFVQHQQTPASDAPETFDKPYQGLLPESGNVVSFLEVILTDFARLESETSTSETTEQDAFDEFMFESKKDKALKVNSKGHKTAKRSDSQQSLAQTEEELKLTQEQLDAAVAYYEKLKPTCVDSGITYEERVKLREQEIQSLEEALKILAGTDLS